MLAAFSFGQVNSGRVYRTINSGQPPLQIQFGFNLSF